MLMPACVCSGVSILKWQERSECSCRHPPVPAGAFCSGRSIHGGTSILLPFRTAGSSRPPTGVLGVLRGRSRGARRARARSRRTAAVVSGTCFLYMFDFFILRT